MNLLISLLFVAAIGLLCCVETSASTERVCGDYGTPCADEEMSILETILLFPLSMGTTGTMEEPKTTDWWSWTTSCVNNVYNDILTAASYILDHVSEMFNSLNKTSSIYLDWVYEFTLTEYLYGILQSDIEVMGTIKQWLVNVQSYVVQMVKSVVQKTFEYVSNVRINVQTFVVELLQSTSRGVLDTMTKFIVFAATIDISRLTTNDLLLTMLDMCVYIQEFLSRVIQHVTNLGISTTELIRYAVFIVLAVSFLPLTRYRGKGQQRFTKYRSYLKTQKRKRSLSPIFEDDGESCNKYGDESAIDPLTGEALNHYLMCEYFDSGNCNCGGKGLQLNADYSDADKHYLMCEYFDLMECNCGGQLSKSLELAKPPLVETVPANIYLPYVAQLCQTEQTHGKSSSTKTRSPLMKALARFSPTNIMKYASSESSNDVGSSDFHEFDEPVIKMNENEKSVSAQSGILADDELDLDASFDSEIGAPCCNSSFKETSPFIIRTIGTEQDIGNGDGPHEIAPLVITKRSPRKELGVSFHNEEIDSFRTGEETFNEDESLLDVSDLNNSISFNRGDGIFEFAVFVAVRFAYRWTKRLFHKRSANERESFSQSYSLDDSKVFVLPSPRKKDSHKSSPVFRNISKNAASDHDSEKCDSATSTTLDSNRDWTPYVETSNAQDTSQRKNSHIPTYSEQNAYVYRYPTNDNIGTGPENDPTWRWYTHIPADFGKKISGNCDDSANFADQSRSFSFGAITDESLPYVYDNDGSRRLVDYIKDIDTTDADISDKSENATSKVASSALTTIESNALVESEIKMLKICKDMGSIESRNTEHHTNENSDEIKQIVDDIVTYFTETDENRSLTEHKSSVPNVQCEKTEDHLFSPDQVPASNLILPVVKENLDVFDPPQD